MALNLSIDLSDATFGDLVALVRAAEVAGVDNVSRLELTDSTLSITATAPSVAAAAGRHRSDAPATRGFDVDDRVLPVLGDQAIRSVIDILTGRQEPPR